MEDRPSGADCECRQGLKPINAKGIQRLRVEKRRRQLAKKFNESNVERNVIQNILEKNKAVELLLRAKVESLLIEDNTLTDFLPLTADKLKYFIHARKFTEKTFQGNKITPAGKKLNKTVCIPNADTIGN